jgi:putative sporulation protein YtaF
VKGGGIKLHIDTIAFIETLFFVIAITIDAGVACFAYGAGKIKIPMSSINIINLVCTGVLAIAILLGGLIQTLIPKQLTTIICFSLLFSVGIFKLFDSTAKSIIKKKNKIEKEIDFNIFDAKFILHIYVDPQKADKDYSKILSIKESIALALALSLDGATAGFGAGISNINPLIDISVFFIVNFITMILGYQVGKVLSEKININISWISGLLLIILAFFKF